MAVSVPVPQAARHDSSLSVRNWDTPPRLPGDPFLYPGKVGDVSVNHEAPTVHSDHLRASERGQYVPPGGIL